MLLSRHILMHLYSILQVQHWPRSDGPAILLALEQSSHKFDRRAHLTAAAGGAMRRHARLRGRNSQGAYLRYTWRYRYTYLTLFHIHSIAGSPDHPVSLQSVLRDDFPTEPASTSHHLLERCQILRDAISARLHVQGRGQRGPEFAAHVSQDGREPAGVCKSGIYFKGHDFRTSFFACI